MATIYSNRNDNTGSHTTVNPNTGTTWVGGAVPAAADQVYIVGRRTTINFSAGYNKWTGTITITVASTTNFAASGFFYTQTSQGDILKVNYTGTTSTTFTGCTLDESDPFYKWNREGSTTVGTIFNGAYVHNPAYVVTINSGETFECNELIIQEGGWLLINGGTLKVNQGIIVRDGRLVGRGTGTILISRPAGTTLSGSIIGYLTAENYYMSVIDIDGGENRVYSTIESAATIGSTYISTVGFTNGTFVEGDEIAVYVEDDYKRRNVGYNGYRDISANFIDMDEGFDVAGVNGDTIYLARRNGARGLIKSVTTVDANTKAVEVDPHHVYFNAGDTVVIENQTYTVNSVEDSEYLAYDYDFTNPATSLSDFWVNDSTHIYSNGWNIESGVGLRTGTDSYRELVHKYLWAREVIVEAEMSPLSAYYTGTRGTGKYSILTTYDPAFRWGHKGDDATKTDYFQINDGSDYIHFYQRNVTQYPNNRLSRNTNLRDQTRTACTYRVVNRKGKSFAYVNGTELTTEIRRDGAYRGLVGIQASNQYFRCKSLKLKIPTQKLYVTTTNSITVGKTVYNSGTEHHHPAGSKVVKISSINTGTGNHQDFAFAYNGQRGNGNWPLIIQVNGANATNASLPLIHNHDANVDYNYDLGNTTSARSLTIDLQTQKQFTHVSFLPRVVDYATYYGYNGVAIYGSNDLTNWTTLYGPTNDTKKWYYVSYNKMAYYPTGTVSYRYVKFETKGAQVSPYQNRYVNLGVHDFSTGYTISVNNASDFNIGDKITILSDSGYSIASREMEAYAALVTYSDSDPEQLWHGGWMMECTITDKSTNTLSLDRPVFWGYIEDQDSVTVIKTNRNFLIKGEILSGATNVSWRWPNITLNAGSNATKKYLFKNVRFEKVGSYRYASSSSFNRGITNYSYDYWNAVLFDGVSYPMGPDGTTWVGLGSQYGHMIVRNSFIAGMYTGIWSYYASSYTGNAAFNNKILGIVNGIYAEAPRAFAANYNEIALCDLGIYSGVMRFDRFCIPYWREVKRNFVKGTSNRGYSLYDEGVSPGRLNKIKLHSNKARGMDDYSIIARTYTGNPWVEMNSMADHTGSRLSRYRNEGHVSSGDVSSALSYLNPQLNIGRFEYDLVFADNHIIERNPLYVNFNRIYSLIGDSLVPFIGLEAEVLESGIPFEVYVQFDYRYPMEARMQDDGTNDGRIRVYSIQNSTIKEDEWGEVPSTMTDGWYTYSKTFTLFSQEECHFAIYVTRSATNNYIDIKNGFAYVKTDQPDKLRVIRNSFNLNRIWDQYSEIRDIKALTGSTGTTKFTKVKF